MRGVAWPPMMCNAQAQNQEFGEQSLPNTSSVLHSLCWPPFCLALCIFWEETARGNFNRCCSSS